MAKHLHTQFIIHIMEESVTEKEPVYNPMRAEISRIGNKQDYGR